MHFPVARRLRILAFDPSLATRIETATVNEITVAIPWEDDLERGPIGEYVEVIDYDPASRKFYEPVDLDARYLLASDGLAPSESNPQFHQQMVYAVAMLTIRQFERALGRVTFWADHRFRTDDGKYVTQFVRRLRIYPHALRARNAYYSPSKKALLFGYFPVTRKDSDNTPGTLVFTCLSHDIIAHEVTHALLDGVHPRFNEATNPDVLGFHEAFADIVALFQHFSYPSVLEHQIQRTRGDLTTESLLGRLAQQFGSATGRGTALRDHLGEKDDETGRWQLKKPDPQALESATGPHDRGAILVAAVFRAFLLMYRAQSADLLRIATQGTGVLPEGELHPDLTRRLAAEAAKSADRVLQICIRAIDYCPPVDITFGDFLRGLITADVDHAPADERGYRIGFIESFREWGIHPRDVTSMSPEALTWPTGDEMLTMMVTDGTLTYKEDWEQRFRNDLLEQIRIDWNLESDRYQVWKALDDFRRIFSDWLYEGDSYGHDYAKVFGLVVRDDEASPTVYRDERGQPDVEIHAIRPAIRLTLDRGTRTDLVVEITQRRRGYFSTEKQAKMDRKRKAIPDDERGDFTYRTGCTIHIDPKSQKVLRVIRTPGTIMDKCELDRIRRFYSGLGATGNAFDAGQVYGGARDEPFALLHADHGE